MTEKKRFRVGFIGVPGTGKSTISQAVQLEMGSHSCITAVCPEYAREFIVKNGLPEHPAVQQKILYKQMRREDTLLRGCDVLFCDSPVFFCYTYALMQLDPDSVQQAKIIRDLYKWAVLDNLHRYDALIYLPRQFEIVDDGVRSPGATELVESSILGFLSAHKHLFKNYTEIWSELEDPQEILHDRVKQIKKYLKPLITSS